jgi:DNA transformation protein
MFGGRGLYVDGVFCALTMRGRLFFKVDDTNRPQFESEGMEAFQPFPDRPGSLSYFELPERVLEQHVELGTWLDQSLDVARRARTRKPRPAQGSSADAAISKLANLGPRSEAWLAKVGVHTRGDLERLGSARTFALVRAAGLGRAALLPRDDRHVADLEALRRHDEQGRVERHQLAGASAAACSRGRSATRGGSSRRTPAARASSRRSTRTAGTTAGRRSDTSGRSPASRRRGDLLNGRRTGPGVVQAPASPAT